MKLDLNRVYYFPEISFKGSKSRKDLENILIKFIKLGKGRGEDIVKRLERAYEQELYKDIQTVFTQTTVSPEFVEEMKKAKEEAEEVHYTLRLSGGEEGKVVELGENTFQCYTRNISQREWREEGPSHNSLKEARIFLDTILYYSLCKRLL